MNDCTGAGPTVCFLITGLEKGGAETQLVRLVLGLHQRGWRVRVITLLAALEFAVELRRVGISVASLNIRRGVASPLGIYRLIRLLHEDRPRILVTFMFHANVLGRLCGRLAGIPAIVSSLRNTRFGGAWRDWLERQTIRLDSVTTTNSSAGAEILRLRGVVRYGRLRVIPNGLPLEQYRFDSEVRGSMRRKEGLTDRDFLWVAVGHLIAQKDYPCLLHAFAEICDHAPPARLWIAGQGPERPRLERQIHACGLAERVRLLGLRHDVPRLLNAADAVVLSSAWEGLPNVVMEALATARPVVATAVGGVSDLIRDRMTGVLVPPENPGALAKAMLRVMDLDPEERWRMGCAGRDHVAATFDTGQVVDQWESVLRSLLK